MFFRFFIEGEVEVVRGAGASPDFPLQAGERGAAAGGVKRSKQLREEVTWLRKTPLMGNSLTGANAALSRLSPQKKSIT